MIEDRAQALRAHLAHRVQPGLWRFHTTYARGIWAGFHQILKAKYPRNAEDE
jgi:hypothetical protein